MAILFSLSLNVCWHTLSWVPKKIIQVYLSGGPKPPPIEGWDPPTPTHECFQSTVEPQNDKPLMNDFLYPSKSKIQSNLYVTAPLYSSHQKTSQNFQLPYTFCKGSHLAISQGWPAVHKIDLYMKKNLDNFYNGTSLLGTNFAIPLAFHYLEAPL